MTTPPSNAKRDLATLFAQAAGAIDQLNGGVVPPIQPSTTFARAPDYTLPDPTLNYGRDQNPVVRIAETVLSEAENAAAGLLFPSGMAAIAAVMRTVANGATIVLQSGIYWGTTHWVREYCARRDIILAEVDAADTALLAETVRERRPAIVFVETPSNPWLKSVDLAAASAACEEVGAILVVDSTAATPVLANPLDHGARIVMHSATKAINGHSDVLAGFLATGDPDLAIWQAIAADRAGAGAILGTFEAWLLLRGMRTLPLRVQRMSETALAIAENLQHHPAVELVCYPGLSNYPGHDVAVRQMSGGFGGLLSICVKGNKADALAACGRLRLFKRATSLGGVESLAEHRHSVESAIPDNLIRLSVGIESVDELIADLDQALSAIAKG